MKLLLLCILLLQSPTTWADTPLSRTFVSGNALINQNSVEKIVKDLMVKGLKKDFDAENKYGGLSLKTDATEHRLNIPQNSILKDILSTLGISNQIKVLIDPIHTSINFGPDSFKININKTGTNVFSIKAHWEVAELVARSKALKIMVPKGAFDQSFTISSHPLLITLKPGSGSVTADISLTATLTNEGSKIKLESFDTNLDDLKQRLQVKLGKLTVNGKPLELEIMSNGESIYTDEPTIRAQFQGFEPELMKSVQQQLGNLIQKQFSAIAEKLENENPFKISLNSTKILSQYSYKNPAITALVKDIKADIIFSYLQELPRLNLFTTQVSSQICVGVDCLTKKWQSSPISTEDIGNIGSDDAGVILYESWVQNVINSVPFQKRIKEYYKKTITTPGVSLGDDGIKVHFNAEKNAITAVLNLKIDIKATGNGKNALSSWSSFKSYSKKQLADMWENIAGSGQYVYLPIEINVMIKGTENNSQGNKELVLETKLEQNSDGSVPNTYKYKCNVQNMNGSIRKELLTSIYSELKKSLPQGFKIGVGKPIELGGVNFFIHQAIITKNNGLLVSGGIQ